MRNKIVDLLCEKARTDKNLMVLTGDLGTGCLEPFAEAFPEQFINCGIAEQNMIAVAAGLALSGKQVVIYSIGNFDSLRAIEFIRNLVCLNNLNVKILSIGAGVEYGSLGATHHATEDLAMMRTLPNLNIYCPATVDECEMITKEMLESTAPCYVRLNKKGVDKNFEITIAKKKCLIKLDYKPSDIAEISDGTDAVILTSGTILKNAVEVVALAQNDGFNISLLSLPILKPINDKKLVKILNKFRFVYVIEENSEAGGLAGIVSEIMAENAVYAKLKKFTLKPENALVVGSRDYLRKVNGLDSTTIFKQIKKDLTK